MQHIFLIQADVVSPRWQQAFPLANVVEHTSDLPLNLSGVMLWILLENAQLLKNITTWTAAGACVVVLTKIENPSHAKQVMELGASGYLHYLATEQVLVQVSQVVQLGGIWLGVDLLRLLVFATADVLSKKQTLFILDVLTVREKSVAQAVTAGKNNKEIARDLNITERTVKAHLSTIFEKLKVRDRLQLVLAMSGGLSGKSL